jgi:hypothetical protein
MCLVVAAWGNGVSVSLSWRLRQPTSLVSSRRPLHPWSVAVVVSSRLFFGLFWPLLSESKTDSGGGLVSFFGYSLHACISTAFPMSIAGQQIAG